MNKKLATLALALLALFALQTASRAFSLLGTGFTYQGRLSDGAGPANGTYDLVFTAYDASDPSGVVIAGPVTNAATVVSNGNFIATVDFGTNTPTVFNFNERWLEIGARTNGAASFVTLTPRQRISATPYALAAVNAASLLGNLPASQVQGTLSLTQLPGGLLTNNQASVSLTGSFTGNGSGLTNVSGLRLEPNGSGAVNVIGGAAVNFVSPGAVGATIGGGGATNYFGFPRTNSVTGDFGTVSGGDGNIAGNQAVVGGGDANTASGVFATVSGGVANLAISNSATVGGGNNNKAIGDYATVGGGQFNSASNLWATVGGGEFNSAGVGSTVGGGNGNHSDAGGVVAGGYQNTATNSYSTVGGGIGNVAGQTYATAGGGVGNLAAGFASTISGGDANVAPSSYATIGGGIGNSTSNNYATCGGGQSNNAWGLFSMVGGGFNNTVGFFSDYATVAGGRNNLARTDDSTVSGGNSNLTIRTGATVGGGAFNIGSGIYAVVGGGYGNVASNDYATVGGGYFNTANNNFATVAGGYNNVASGLYSFAAGVNAQALHQGAFVWADSQSASFASTANDQFLIRAAGGVGIGTGSPQAQLNVNGTARIDANTTPYSEGLTLNFPTDMPGSGYGGIDFHNAARGAAYSASTIKWGMYYNYTPEGGTAGNGLSFVQNNLNTRLFISTNGNVAIGTSTPTQLLHLNVTAGHGEGMELDSAIAGDAPAIYLNHTGPAGRKFRIASYGDNSTPGSLRIRDESANAYRVTMDASGNVGIGTIIPDALLTVNGSADKPGGGSWGTYSDARLKDIGESFTNGLEALEDIQPIHYHYKSDNPLNLPAQPEYIGVVAQEVKRSVPEAVEQSKTGYLVVNNDPIFWTTVNAVKSLNRKVADSSHESEYRIQKLEAENADLKKRLERLERLIETKVAEAN